ncbi:LysR family transcriptional regulator [Anaerorhabdus furcosa]|uniref:DNA-binding transcriptional regulator, LysR family n=1 Tax=Anaerorhabdus furcosa TaxID=118967 RepID=A0A1T4MEX9_9FIRM|nr:LysR family transcriptional regulator [Anaerorhabdus furcosa]SJZ65417.1 DNA-binding transcriptional regulator, LysR family [Anaerorhabdus furcosa]
MIDPKLETLLAVHETKSFTKAAKHLNLTQPAVSQHIKMLEKDLGAQLFLRTDGALKTTVEGEIAVKYATRIKTLYQNLKQAIIDQSTHLTRLTIGITHTAESNYMVETLARYSSDNHGVLITIISDTIKNLYKKLKTYEIDMAIVEGKIIDNNFNHILLDTDYLILAVSKDSPLSKKKIVTLNDLKKEKLILRLPNSDTRKLFASHLQSNGYSIHELNIILEVDNVSTIKDLIMQNFGSSILPHSVLVDEIKKNKIIGLPIENLTMSREVNLMYHKDFNYPELLQEIVSLYSSNQDTN